jgi:hypothetical protein
MVSQQNRVYYDHSDIIYHANTLPYRAHLEEGTRHLEVIALMDLLDSLKKEHVTLKNNTLLCNKMLELDKNLEFSCFGELREILDATLKEDQKRPAKDQVKRQNTAKARFLREAIKQCRDKASGVEYLPIFLAFVHHYSPEKTKALYETYFHPLGIHYEELPWVSLNNWPRRYKMSTPDPDNPFDEGNIPFHYRDAEFEKLEAFAAKDGKDTQFQIWAISGPSGAGKTRLAHHWLLTSKIMEKWDQIVIEAKSRTHCNPHYWQNEFELHRPTVLVMDYVDSMRPHSRHYGIVSVNWINLGNYPTKYGFY